MKKYCIVNHENQKVIDKLKEYGYTCIPTEKSACVSEPISLHADVLYLRTKDNEIYVSDCQINNIHLLKNNGFKVIPVNLEPGYKTESKLNLVITDNTIVYNPKTAINTEKFGICKKAIYINQGYTRCSTIAMEDNYITEDNGIYKALINSGKNCLLIDKGYVKLNGYDYGFIGGASAYLSETRTLMFFGDISKHPDFYKIQFFCNEIGVVIDMINTMPLSDIGGVVKF